MRSFRKLIALSFLTAALMAGEDLAAAQNDAGKDQKAGEKKKKDRDKKKEKERAKDKKVADAEPGRRDMIPIPPGHDSKGLKIPYFDSTGKLQMTFNIGVATRLDDSHVRMADLQVETFDDTGASEMFIQLPTSVLNLDTRVISAQTHVTIKRDDFELTGEAIEFNTQTKQGKLAGGVRMLIYDLDEMSDSGEKSGS
jgi:hypothetical protein